VQAEEHTCRALIFSPARPNENLSLGHLDIAQFVASWGVLERLLSTTNSNTL
jgi:hypothetical protein